MNGAVGSGLPRSGRRRAARCTQWSWVAGALLISNAARGQQAAPAPDEPDRLFEAARALFAKGEFRQACQQFAASYELRPRHGTLLNLAVCLDQQGDKRAALSRFQESLAAATSDGRTDRIELAQARIERLKAELSWLELRPSGSQTPGLTISCDDESVAPGVEGPIAVEPGRHVVRASAAGRAPFETIVVLEPGASRTIEIPELDALETPTMPAAPSPQVVSLRPLARRTDADATVRASWTPVAISLLAAGAASVAVGGVLGFRAISDSKEIERICSSRRCTTTASLTTATRLDARAHTEARIADFTLPLGVAAIAAGTYFLFARPAPSQHAAVSSTQFEIGANASPSAAAATVRGTW